MAYHYPCRHTLDKNSTYKTKEFYAGTEWTYTRCNTCSAVLKVKEMGHWLFGKKYEETSNARHPEP